MKNNQSDIPARTAFSVEEAADRCWKTMTQSANDLYHAGRYHLAAHYYDAAFKEAQDIFLAGQLGTLYENVDPAPLLIASATNLAENSYQCDMIAAAQETLTTMIDLLVTVLQDPGAPKCLSEQCNQHLGYAVTRLATFMKNVGASETQINSEIQTAQLAAFTYMSQSSVKH